MRGWFTGVLIWAACGVWVQGQGCSKCAEWNKPQKPFRIYGDTYYVGPHGLASVLIVSEQGDVLIDGALAISAKQIANNIRSLGFKLSDVRVILNSHVHNDHAGGIAELQRMTGARVEASPWTADLLKHGGVAKDDPQYGETRGVAKVSGVSTLKDGEIVRVGSLALTAHFTPGHTLGGTSWTWQSCKDGRCVNMVYADSVNAVARSGFRFADHPEILGQFARTFAWLDSVPCDVLITPHPEASNLFGRVASGKVVDGTECRRLAEQGRQRLKERLEKEAVKR